jgi:hypothetical protein
VNAAHGACTDSSTSDEVLLVADDLQLATMGRSASQPIEVLRRHVHQRDAQADSSPHLRTPIWS